MVSENGIRNDMQPIILVSGLPRSGTSMLMQMLDAAGIPIASDGIRIADRDNPEGYYELEKVKEIGKTDDLSWLNDLRGKAVKIISWFLKDLPDEHKYKILFIERDLREVITSQNRMLVNRGEKLDPEHDEEMIRLFDDHTKETKALLSTKPGFEVIYLNHRAIIDNPAAAAGQINRFLGGMYDEAKIAGAVKKKLYRNRQ